MCISCRHASLACVLHVKQVKMQAQGKIQFSFFLPLWLHNLAYFSMLTHTIACINFALAFMCHTCEPGLSVKVFWYSFSGTIPNVFNQLFSKLSSVGSMWNLHQLLVLDWSLFLCTFQPNRYCHGNDKQKTLKSVKLEFCAIQISPGKANTKILNYDERQIKYTRIKKLCMFDLE